VTAIPIDPALQASVVPFVTALVLTFVLRLAGDAGPALAGAAIGCGVFATYVVILGLPPLPPVTATHKIGAIIVAGVVVGVALELYMSGSGRRAAAVLLLAGLAIIWIGWRGVFGMQKLEALIVSGGWAAAAVALPQLKADESEATESAAILLVAGAALAIVAVIGAVASLGQLAGAVAAASGGFALVNWLWPRHPFGAAAQLGGGLVLFVLATAIALFSDAEPLAIALILPAFFARPVARLLPLGRGNMVRYVRPVAVAAIAAIPALAAVGAAVILGDGQRPYGY